MKHLLFLLSFLFVIQSSAQSHFEKALGASGLDQAFAGQQTTDHGFIAAGYSMSAGAGRNDCYLVKSDSLGTPEWYKTYGGSNDDQAYSVEQTTDGGYILCGYTKSFGAGGYDVYVIKTTATGDTLWTKTYGGARNDFGNAVRQTSDGGYIIAGYTLSFVTGADSGNAYLIKTDANGGLKWAKSFGATNNITDAYSVKETSDKGFILTGYTNGFGEPSGDVFLTKTDSVGNVLFTKTYGGKGTDWGNSIVVTTDGGYMVSGTYSSDSTSTDMDAYLIKTNSLGDTLFTRTFGGSGYDFGQTVVQTAEGGYVLSGYTNSFGAGNYDAFLLRTTASGDTIFTRTYGGTDDDEANCVFRCMDGSYGLAGFTKSYGAGDYDFLLIKTDTSGFTGCSQHPFSALPRQSATKVNTATFQVVPTVTTSSPTPTHISASGQSYDICNPIGLGTEKSITEELRIFPNPGTGLFTLLLSNTSSEEIQIILTNLQGDVIFRETEQIRQGPYEKIVDFNGFSAGIYLLHTRTEKVSSCTKLILQK
jgi:hypothetical protein